MLTERGWAVAGAGVALATLWYLFGETELGVAALLALGALTGSILVLGGKRPYLQVTRRTSPAGIHEGSHASVMLRLQNRGGTLRHISVSDEVEGLGTAEFAAATFASGSELHAVYRVLCRPRGIYTIGPASVTLRDPLGLSSRSHRAGRADTLVVYPRVEDLSGLPGSPGQNLSVDSSRPRHGQRGGEDFYTLREYQQGDDFRRIHWPSSARVDRLMIRQLETPWQSRSLVLFDVRAGSYTDGEAFELAVSGAASVTRHLMDHSFDSELWTGGPTVSVSARGRGYAVAMERLARVQPEDRVDLSAVAAGLRNRGGGGMLILVTGRPDEDLLGLTRVLGAEYPTAVLLATRGGPYLPAFQGAGVTTVTPESERSWSSAWSDAMRTSWHSASVGS
ncbi:MAG: DUF58 domain-containing protein [Actinomycetota bacterium]